MPRSLYVHIPFCHRRCFYCDFPVVPLGDHASGATSGSVNNYLQQLYCDLDAAPFGPPLSTVYIGGGTPSLLSVTQISGLLDRVESKWGLAADAEVTLEIDPASFDQAWLQAVLQRGVNRCSLGGQSFNDEALKRLGRRHSAAQLRQCCAWLREAELAGLLCSWSLDLILNLPEQSAHNWQEELSDALRERPPHLSIYDLIIEPGTVFEWRERRGDLQLPDLDSAAERLEYTHGRLASLGYGHYEISNWALPGHSSRHNRMYWGGAAWWALGLGATAGAGAERLARPRTRDAYGQWLLQQPGQQVAAGIHLGSLPPLEDLLLVGLRRREGVDLNWLEASGAWCGDSAMAEALKEVLAPWLAQGLVELGRERLRLLAPQGFNLSNAVLRDLFAWLQRGNPPLEGFAEELPARQQSA